MASESESEEMLAECRHCGEDVQVDESGHYKSVSDEFWHEDCFAEYCYERRSLVATPEGSFKIKPVIIKEIEDGMEKVLDSFWRADCPVCYKTHESDEMEEDIRNEFSDEVIDCCDTEWMAPADWIEDCDICGTDHRESAGCKPLPYRDPFPSVEDHRFDCSECDWSGEGDDFDNHRGECPSCGTTSVRAVRVATDGGQVQTSTDRVTVTIHVWQGGQYASYDDLLDDDPDVYELPLAETDFGKAFEVSDDELQLLAENIEYHGTFAFDVPNDERPVTLNVQTTDSYHNREDWGKPIERGLTFHEEDAYEPFKTEIWGRIMMWAERPEVYNQDEGGRNDRDLQTVNGQEGDDE